jgi:hypothetical protein
MLGKKELPSTLERSPKKAQRTGDSARKGGATAGGVDANASTSHPMDELLDAIENANAQQARKSRS